MSADNVTLGELKKLTSLFNGDSSQCASKHSLQIGQSYLIRTVTMHYTGRLVAVTDSDIQLEDAAWIANTGRYHDALLCGSLSEVEPYPDGVVVSRAVIVDVAKWTHKLPREQK